MNVNIQNLTLKQARDLLEKIVNKLDELDEEDFFGTEGWKHFFGLD